MVQIEKATKTIKVSNEHYILEYHLLEGRYNLKLVQSGEYVIKNAYALAEL